MVLKLELKRCADLAHSTYLDMMKTKLLFKFTMCPLGEKFPNPARQKKEYMSY
jgi:hypothetical protein